MQLLWILGLMGRKVVTTLCAQKAEKPILDEAGKSPAYFYCKSWTRFLPSKFTRVQFYTEIGSKS